jgi:hypothetical protein
MRDVEALEGVADLIEAGLGVVGGGMRQNEDEFLPTVPAHDVGASDIGSEQPARLAEQHVAGLVSECVAELLKWSRSSTARQTGR